MQVKSKRIPGGGFLLEKMERNAFMSPEDFTEEQRMFAETVKGFLEKEVEPNDEQLEKLDYALTVKLLRRAGELGLLAAEIPEEFGGLGLDKVSAMIIAETLAKSTSFALSLGAHKGIGTLPIVFFGNRRQKEKYLPDLAAGKKIAAYCLTEPSSGSDALGAKTTAKLSPDGKHYVLNGQKQFITNAGFADVFIVYAKIDGKDFTAFIVEKEMEGVSLGPEEKKMGIKGSSTRPLFLEDVKVPVENVLGEIGKGHVIAFNILNIGRFKLAGGCLGTAKAAIALAAKYANERTQFGKPISSFPLIAGKLAEMNIWTYALESIVYRTAGLIDQALAALDHASSEAGPQAAEGISEYAIECSINKVFGSEVLDAVVDHGVQIHGGYGYIQEYRIERYYRDARINRIFEGTNEINRLLISGMLLKKAQKGELPFWEKAQALPGELMQPLPPVHHELLEEETQLVENAKKIALSVGAQAVQKYQRELEQQQEILSDLSDIIILIYAMESALLRALKRLERFAEDDAGNAVEMTRVFVHESMEKIAACAREVLARIEAGDALRTQLSLLKKLTRRTPIDTIRLKREIAARVSIAERYVV
ncbi:acyl-CoA dehydrogenase family protein [Bacillaceae bacterium]